MNLRMVEKLQNHFPGDLELELSAWDIGTVYSGHHSFIVAHSALTCNFTSCVHSAWFYNEYEYWVEWVQSGPLQWWKMKRHEVGVLREEPVPWKALGFQSDFYAPVGPWWSGVGINLIMVVHISVAGLLHIRRMYVREVGNLRKGWIHQPEAEVLGRKSVGQGCWDVVQRP